MDFKISEVTDKPENWPANAIECQFENISEQIDKFKKDPSYKNKEVLVSLVTDYDLNQRSMLGLFRTTDYEVACINTLFLEANFLQLNALKTYLYELIGYKTRMQKMMFFCLRVGEFSINMVGDFSVDKSKKLVI